MPGLANGHVGTIVYNSDFHVNGFYHGQLDKSNRVRVPNFIAFWVESDGNRTYSFDIRQATFTETIWNTASGVNITTVMYANMADKHYLVTEITMSRNNAFDADVTVQLKNLTQFDTWDMKVLNFSLATSCQIDTTIYNRGHPDINDQLFGDFRLSLVIKPDH